MTFCRGALFGSYEILEPIGSGGMGEVYRARDTTLGRDVAIKVLPASFSNDAVRVARFEQEAKTLASLNHANIAHIYGLERSDGSTGIVMELVGGETLVDRLAQGRIPVDEALRIATQIADALEAAHERAIVHRDLKPANVKIKPDGTVKVLDFGIAKALDPRFLTGPGPAALTTPAMTEAGFILGTAAYMSPEQARGKFVDQRTDVWAFGCVLYEMLTGKPAFLGEDVTSTLARVLETSAKLDALPRDVPPAVRRTLELCLEKDARKRIADMRDVKLALAGTFSTTAPAPVTRVRALTIAAAAVAAALLTSAAWYLRPAPPPEPKIVTRFEYTLPPGVDLRTTATSVLSIAPSGDLFAFNGTGGIYVRRMGESEARLIPGTIGNPPAPVYPDVVVSPDGREVAFFRGPPGKLMKVSIDGGTPVVLADVAPVVPFGLSWARDGTLYYGQPDGIWRVSQNGGTPEHVVKTQPEEQICGPRLLPGGQWLLFTVTKTTGPGRWNEGEVVIQSLASGERRTLRSGAFDARYVPTGHLTYMVGNVLFASTFDLDSLKVGEERVPLADGVRVATPPPGGIGFYAVADNGTLIFIPETAGPPRPRPRRGLVWVDRAGKATPLPIPPNDYTMARLSPDGRKIALVLGSALPLTEPPPDIYVYDLDTENVTQLTFDSTSDDGPVWSRDGSTIYYRRSEREGENIEPGLLAMPAGGGTPKLLARTGAAGTRPLPWSLSTDGNTLLVVDAASLSDVNLATLDLAKHDGIKPLLDLTETITEPSLSTNGQWLAYSEAQGDSGRTEVNLRPYPDVRQQRRPVGPGGNPVFSADGSEVFVFDGEGISAAALQYAPLRVGALKHLFSGRYWYGVGGPDGLYGRAWDIDSKNDRFLMITLPEEEPAAALPAPRAQINVVLNWFVELERRVPKH